MVTTFQNYWRSHRKAVIFGGVVFVLLAVFLPHVVHAQSSTAQPDTTCTDLIKGLGHVIDVLKRVLWPVLLMIGGLMQNDILFGPGMEQTLTQIWINVRNFVNILFVLILLVIAIVNVVGAAERMQYKLNEILPKFVIALIAVNFTFIGAKLVLDGVNIVSTAIFALPDQVQQTLQANSGSSATASPFGVLSVDDVNSFCGAIYGGSPTDPASDYATNVNASTGSSPGGTICTTSKDSNGSYLNSSNSSIKSFFSSMNAQNAALIMAITLQHATQLDQVNVNQPVCNGLFVNTFFTIILFIVYAAAYIALFVTLLVRLVVLWVMIAISPLMFLPSVLPESIKGSLGEAGDIGKKFVQNAIVPIPVALVMSIGFIMLKGMNQYAGSGPTATQFINGNPTLALGLYTSGLTTLQQLIVSLGAVAFIWVGVFEAMKGTYAGHIVESIKNGVSGAGKALGGFAVKSIPLFPTTNARGEKTKATVGDVMQFPGALQRKFDTKEREHFEENFGKYVLTDDQAIGNVGGAKNFGDLKNGLGQVSSDVLKKTDKRQKLMQQMQASYQNLDKDSKAKFEQAIKDSGYKGGVAAFLKDKDISEKDMTGILDKMGIHPGSPRTEGPETPKEEAEKAQKLASAGTLFKNKDDLAKKKVLTPGEVKELSELEKTINKTKGSTKPEDVEAYKKAMDRVQQLKEKADNLTGNSNLTDTFQVDFFNSVQAKDYKGAEDKMNTMITKLSGGKTEGPEYEQAKKRVMELASQKITADQKAAAPAGSLVSQIPAPAAAAPAPVAPVAAGSKAPKPKVGAAAPVVAPLKRGTKPTPTYGMLKGTKDPTGWVWNGTDWDKDPDKKFTD